MTKRISVNNVTHADEANATVDANAAEAAIAAAQVGMTAQIEAAVQAGDAPVAGHAGVADADAPVGAPVELAMVAAGDGAAAVFAGGGQDDTGDTAPADTGGDSGFGGEDHTDLMIGGGLLAAAVVGAVVVGSTGSDAEDHAGNPPAPPPVPSNEAPAFDADSQDLSTDEDTALVVTSAATDADGDDLTYTVTDGEHGTVTTNEDGTFTYTPDADFNGTDSFTVTASDGTDDAVQTINVTIDAVNDAPVFAEEAATATFEENADVATAVYTAAATDVDADDTLTYSLSGDDADAFTIDADSGEIHFVSSPDFEAQSSYDVTVTATDAAGDTATQALTVDITDVDDTVTADLDVDSDSNLNTETAFDASGGDIVFTEDANAASNAGITGFGEGDTIVASNVDTDGGDAFSFTSTATDVVISFASDTGATNVITLHDVVTADSPFVFDEASAETAIGFDFFQYA